MKLSRRLTPLIVASFLIVASALAAGIVLDRTPAHAQSQAAIPGEYFAPYSDVTIGSSLQTVTQSTGQKYYTLAFITIYVHGWYAQSNVYADDFSPK